MARASQKYISKRFTDKRSLFFIKRTMHSSFKEKYPYSSGLVLEKSQGSHSSKSGKLSKNTHWIIWELHAVEKNTLFLWPEEWRHPGPIWETLKCCHFSGWWQSKRIGNTLPQKYLCKHTNPYLVGTAATFGEQHLLLYQHLEFTVLLDLLKLYIATW